MSRIIYVISILAGFLLSLSVYAHHGATAHYDVSSTITVEATIVDLKLVNPHGYVYFDVRGEDGAIENWRCELGTRLSRRGWNSETLVAGDRVRVTGNPARREAHVCKLEFIEHEDGRTIPFRGAITEGSSDYVPSEESIAVDTSTQSRVLATADTTAASRLSVEVPEEGFFGYWAAPGGTTSGNTGGGMGMGMGGAMNAGPPPDSEFPMSTPFPIPDYTPEGQALVDAYEPGFDNTILYCRSSMFDGMTHHGVPNEFVQESDNVIRWVYGFMDLVRYVYLDRSALPIDAGPSYLGHSVGHWEEDTLVVETTGFHKDLFMQLGGEGAVVNSPDLSVTERITHDKALDQLVIEYTAEDPTYWRAPISGVLRLGRSPAPYETYGCVELAGENNVRPDGSTIFD